MLIYYTYLKHILIIDYTLNIILKQKNLSIILIDFQCSSQEITCYFMSFHKILFHLLGISYNSLTLQTTILEFLKYRNVSAMNIQRYVF